MWWILLRGGQQSLRSKGKNSYKDIEVKDVVTTDRLAAVGQIAAGIAHEVRNPLTAVKGFLQLLQKEQPHAYLDIASQELENALTTMQNLLYVSKPDFVEEELSYFNPCSELESILYLFQDQIYQVDIIKEFKDTSVNMYGRKNQLKKVFFNLLKNAFEAIDGHGTITVKHSIKNNNIIISIADSGVGIPKEKLSLLGTPFFTSKEMGTGMGLTQVYSTIYEHLGQVEVESEVGKGTRFTIYFPIEQNKDQGVVDLDLVYKENQDFQEFYEVNQNLFNELLRKQGKDTWDHIQEAVDEANHTDGDFIIYSSHKIVSFLNETDEYGLVMHAKEQGQNWAKLDLDLVIVMEWFQNLRKLYWDFLFNYYQNKKVSADLVEFFELERNVNYKLDSYVKHFSSSFSEYKNDVLRSQTQLIEDLNVPIIPLTDSMAILPIIGMVDTRRAKKIQIKVLEQIYQYQLKHIIIDLSGVAYLDTAVLGHLFNIVSGIRIQGCKAILTGIRPEITNTIVELGIDLHDKVETKGTLKQAIQMLLEPELVK